MSSTKNVLFREPKTDEQKKLLLKSNKEYIVKYGVDTFGYDEADYEEIWSTLYTDFIPKVLEYIIEKENSLVGKKPERYYKNHDDEADYLYGYLNKNNLIGFKTRLDTLQTQFIGEMFTSVYGLNLLTFDYAFSKIGCTVNEGDVFDIDVFKTKFDSLRKQLNKETFDLEKPVEGCIYFSVQDILDVWNEKVRRRTEMYGHFEKKEVHDDRESISFIISSDDEDDSDDDNEIDHEVVEPKKTKKDSFDGYDLLECGKYRAYTAKYGINTYGFDSKGYSCVFGSSILREILEYLVCLEKRLGDDAKTNYYNYFTDASDPNFFEFLSTFGFLGFKTSLNYNTSLIACALFHGIFEDNYGVITLTLEDMDIDIDDFDEEIDTIISKIDKVVSEEQDRQDDMEKSSCPEKKRVYLSLQEILDLFNRKAEKCYSD